MLVIGVVIALGMVIVSVGASRGAAGVTIAAFIVLGNAGSNALARNNGQWENSPPHIRRWFQELNNPTTLQVRVVVRLMPTKLTSLK